MKDWLKRLLKRKNQPPATQQGEEPLPQSWLGLLEAHNVSPDEAIKEFFQKPVDPQTPNSPTYADALCEAVDDYSVRTRGDKIPEERQLVGAAATTLQDSGLMGPKKHTASVSPKEKLAALHQLLKHLREFYLHEAEAPGHIAAQHNPATEKTALQAFHQAGDILENLLTLSGDANLLEFYLQQRGDPPSSHRIGNTKQIRYTDDGQRGQT